MNKLKTKHSAAKRFKRTRNNKIVRRKAYRGHILEKKTSKQKRNLRNKGLVFKGEIKAINKMLPYY